MKRESGSDGLRERLRERLRLSWAFVRYSTRRQAVVRRTGQWVEYLDSRLGPSSSSSCRLEPTPYDVVVDVTALVSALDVVEIKK